MQHGLGKRLLLGVVHAVEIDGHQQCADLIVGNGPLRHAVDEEVDLFTGEMLAVAFLSNYVLRSQSSLPQVLVIITTA